MRTHSDRRHLYDLGKNIDSEKRGPTVWEYVVHRWDLLLCSGVHLCATCIVRIAYCALCMGLGVLHGCVARGPDGVRTGSMPAVRLTLGKGHMCTCGELQLLSMIAPLSFKFLPCLNVWWGCVLCVIMCPPLSPMPVTT